MDINKKSRKDYEKYLNSISPDRDDEAWIIGGKNILAEIGGDKIFITTGKYAVNFWCWKK